MVVIWNQENDYRGLLVLNNKNENMYRDENSIYCSYIVPHPFCFRIKGKTQLSD